MPKSNASLDHWADSELPAVRKALSDWFGVNARDLPWRAERSVYRTVVSEFMLQQTRVSTVIPYFERWTETFPDFSALAQAGESEVLSLWQGLGYYSRARNLHKLAACVVESGIPKDVEEWRKLPGIGEYTAAAVASIAQEEREAVVDGNVVRVLARLSADETVWKSSGEAVKAFGPPARRFLDSAHPGRHNEALMELGALVCLPRSPLCTVCPLVRFCRAAAKGIASEVPKIRKATKVRKTVRRVWVTEGHSILLREIPASEKRLAGMLELPCLDDSPVQWRAEAEAFYTGKRGIGNESITEPLHRAESPDSLPEGSGLRWVKFDEMPKKPLSGPHRKWIREVLVGELL